MAEEEAVAVEEALAGVAEEAGVAEAGVGEAVVAGAGYNLQLLAYSTSEQGSIVDRGEQECL